MDKHSVEYWHGYNAGYRAGVEAVLELYQDYKERENRLSQVPDAPPYKIGDEDYQDRVTCEQYSPYLKDNGADWSDIIDWQKSVRYI